MTVEPKTLKPGTRLARIHHTACRIFLGYRAHRAAQPQPNPQTVLQENAEGAENLSNEIPLRALRTPVKRIGLKICPTNMHAGKPHFEPLCQSSDTEFTDPDILSALCPSSVSSVTHAFALVPM